MIQELIKRKNELLKNAKEKGLTQEQKHLDNGTTEREYWHYGYAICLNDILKNFHLIPNDNEIEKCH